MNEGAKTLKRIMETVAESLIGEKFTGSLSFNFFKGNMSREIQFEKKLEINEIEIN